MAIYSINTPLLYCSKTVKVINWVDKESLVVCNDFLRLISFLHIYLYTFMFLFLMLYGCHTDHGLMVGMVALNPANFWKSANCSGFKTLENHIFLMWQLYSESTCQHFSISENLGSTYYFRNLSVLVNSSYWLVLLLHQRQLKWF